MSAPVEVSGHRTTLPGMLTAQIGTAPATEVSAALSDAADGRTRALVEEFIAVAGPPPAAFAWMAVGSHARRELHAASDQDHALVWADEEAATSPFARHLAEAVIAGLTEFGMRPCTGGHMADHWSFSLLEWERMLHDHVAAPDADSAVDTDVLLDLRPIAGDLDVRAVTGVISSARDAPQLLQELAESVQGLSVPGSRFGRKGKSNRTFHVTNNGLAPVVLLARLHGLRAGTDSTGTFDRLAAAAAAGLIDEQLAARLQFAYALFTRVRLEQQAAALAGLSPLTDTIDVDSLAWTDLELLRRAFASVRSAQAEVALANVADL